MKKHASLLPNPFKFMRKSSTSDTVDSSFVPESNPFDSFGAGFPAFPAEWEKEGDWTWNNNSLLDSNFAPPVAEPPVMRQPAIRQPARLLHGPPASRVPLGQLNKRISNGPMKPLIYEDDHLDKGDEKLLAKVPLMGMTHSGLPGEDEEMKKLHHRTDEHYDMCEHCPKKVKIIKVKMKAKPKIIIKTKKIYIPKKIIKKVPVKVVKKVPKYIIKEKIKVVPVIKKVKVVKKVKVPVPYKVVKKIVKIKKVKVPVIKKKIIIKKVKVPVFKKKVILKKIKVPVINIYVGKKKKKKKKKCKKFCLLG